MNKNFFLYYIPAILSILFIITLAGCNKNEQTPPTKTDVLFIGHKGGGSNSYSEHFENTIPAVQDGVKYLDGAEVDIQMSLDSTLWIFHNVDIADLCCDTSYHKTIILLHDSEIENIKLCNHSKTARIYRLSELIDLWNTSQNGFIISLHIKTDFSDTQYSKYGGEKPYLLKLAGRLAVLLTPLKHPNKIFVEVYDKDFCSKLKKLVPSIYICLIGEGSFTDIFTKALSGGYHGISCQFNQQDISLEEVNRAKDSGLVIELWTPYYFYELSEALLLKPTVIQTDNMNAMKILNVSH